MYCVVCDHFVECPRTFVENEVEITYVDVMFDVLREPVKRRTVAYMMLGYGM